MSTLDPKNESELSPDQTLSSSTQLAGTQGTGSTENPDLPEATDPITGQPVRKLEKRRVFGSKDGDLANNEGAETATDGAMPNTTLGSQSPEPARAPTTPGRSASPFSDAASPHRYLRSTSPRALSPATSMIFERDVQENTIAPELAPGIPSHITTEDHIPAVLEASSLAITDDQLDPDEVEIVTHPTHQPAVATLSGGGLGEAQSVTSHSELGLNRDMEESNASYGALDTTDPRRLSFISFADVVHAEHVESQPPPNLFGLSAAVGSIVGNRSPSPVRAPLAALRTYPPEIGVIGPPAAESSPTRGPIPLGSPLSAHSASHGELNIETMRETIEKTGSNDQPLSAVASEDGIIRSFR